MPKLCKKCNASIANRTLINGILRNTRHRFFCLNCSPYGKRVRNLYQLPIDQRVKTCPACKKEKSSKEFYRRRNGKNLSVYCKPCTYIQATDRQQKLKQQCVSYKGNKCQKCGYNKYIGALEFHHLNPLIKDFQISQGKTTSFNQRIINELDKCILLCSNCHKEEHAIQRGSYTP